MAKSAHYGTTFPAPVNIILMTTDALFVKCGQQRNRYLLCQLLFVTSGTLAPFALISVGKNIKIMVADPAPEDIFV